MRVLVSGAGGFIGSHMVNFLKAKGCWVRGVDIKEPMFSRSQANEFLLLDLRGYEACLEATRNMEQVYNFAANMGGIGYITKVRAEVMEDNVLMNVNMLKASKLNKVNRFLFSSSACVYPEYLQSDANVKPLKESDALPALPDTYYGWEKLFTELLMQAYREDFGLNIRIIRFHNVYGPEATFKGLRAKVIGRMIHAAIKHPEKKIQIWGNGNQTRSFLYIDDAIQGVYQVMNSKHSRPFNIGSNRLITMNDLAKLIICISGKTIEPVYVDGPKGVEGRNADLTLVNKMVGWQPKVNLETGIKQTYEWMRNILQG